MRGREQLRSSSEHREEEIDRVRRLDGAGSGLSPLLSGAIYHVLWGKIQR